MQYATNIPLTEALVAAVLESSDLAIACEESMSSKTREEGLEMSNLDLPTDVWIPVAVVDFSDVEVGAMVMSTFRWVHDVAFDCSSTVIEGRSVLLNAISIARILREV